MAVSESTFLSQSARARIRVFNALSELLVLDQKPLDEIQVKEICSRAQISRSTFYTYFEDKYAILQWFTDLVHNAGVGEIGRTLTWEEGHTITTAVYLAHIETLDAANRSKDYNAIGPHSIRRREASLRKTLQNYRGVYLTTKLEMEIVALAAAEAALADRYLRTVNTPSVEEFVDALISIVPRDIYELLQIDEKDVGMGVRNGDLDILNMLTVQRAG